MIGLFKRLFPPSNKRENKSGRRLNGANNPSMQSNDETAILNELNNFKKYLSSTEELQILQNIITKGGNYESLKAELQNLMKYSPENYDVTFRLKHWNGKIIAQQGIGINVKVGTIALNTPVGEYFLEFSLNPIKNSTLRYQILWLGLDYAGKSSLIHRFRFNSFQTQSRTYGQDIEDFILEGLRLTTIDVGGQKSLRDYWDKIPMTPNMIVYVIDAFDKKRYNEAKAELKKYVIDNIKYERIPLLILLNKIDLLENPDVGYVILKELNLDEILDLRTWHAIPVSAKTGFGLEDTIAKMSEFLISEQRK